MSSTPAQQMPVIPPRPNRNGQDRDQLKPEMPKVPPRPIKRAVSPNPDRYAPSPLHGGIPAKKDRANSHGDPIDRSKSVELPAVVGEEGMEYAALEEQLSSREPSTSPTQTRTIGENLKIHAPKAALPALSAKQRIMQVTRTDSDRAAAFGIGRPSGGEQPTPSNRSLKKKSSTTSQLSQSEIEDEERGIPEIGVHVPLLAYAGDVQAPSPAPGSDTLKLAHKRKTSSRGLPPGSYGLHGHNIEPEDKLEKEYYKKHPELLKLEHHTYQHDRATDFSMSREELNKMVRETEASNRGDGAIEEVGTPSEQAAWAAYNGFASRPQSAKPQEGSPLKHTSEPEVIVIDEPNHRRSVLFSDEATPAPPQDEPESDYRAPILAEDEVRKNTPRFDQVPAVELSRERRGSDYDMEPPRSRPTSRPASLYKMDSADMRSTPLEDVEEYEPLFPEDEEGDHKHNLTAAQIKEMKQRFPSRDIWEEPPSSVHYTAEVNTPDIDAEEQIKKVPSRDQTETPAHAFARQQEALAEKEGTHPDAYLWRTQKPSYIAHQPHLAQDGQALWNQHQDARKAQDASRPGSTQPRFPSRDVWEDTPDSLKLETTVSGPQMDHASPVDKKPEIPERPQTKDKPVIPERPKPKSPEETAAKPVIPDRPKPQIPARPAKTSAAAAAASGEAPAPKAKPAVPARPAGNKIAALQAGFMADLNKKLGLGPPAPKPEEEEEPKAATEDMAAEPAAAAAQKAPLSDTRRGRARGPQRRAPTAAAPPVAKPAAAEKPTLSFSTTVTVWSLDPEDDMLVMDDVEVGDVTEAPGVKALESVNEETGANEPVKAVEETPAKTAEEAPAKAEPEVETEAEARAEEAKVAQEIVEAEKSLDDKDEDKEKHSVETKTETLATNTAGETLAEATVVEDKATSKVEPKEVDTNVVQD
ncbi:unnamed protein product [Discula destructiva]